MSIILGLMYVLTFSANLHYLYSYSCFQPQKEESSAAVSQFKVNRDLNRLYLAVDVLQSVYDILPESLKRSIFFIIFIYIYFPNVYKMIMLPYHNVS